MGLVLFRIKVLPSEAGVDLDAMAKSIESKLPAKMAIRTRGKEPIAFGLEALLLDIQAPEEDGVSDSLEDSIRSANLVGDVQILGVSKLSTSLK